MANVVISELARRDVRGILSHLNDVAGFSVARRYADAFKAAYGVIARFPGSGAPPSCAWQ